MSAVAGIWAAHASAPRQLAAGVNRHQPCQQQLVPLSSHRWLLPPVAATLAASSLAGRPSRRARLGIQGVRQVVRASSGGREPVRPGVISPVKEVPPEIRRPAYLSPGTRIDRRTGLPVHPFLYAAEVKTAKQIEAMRRACALAREALLVAKDIVAPGATTDDIDSAVHEFIVSHGAYPSPLGYMGFPKSVSTSVNDVIAHGIPDDRVLQEGDILNVDVTVFIDGHHGDTSSMFVVGRPDPGALELCKAAQLATMEGIEVCGPGVDFRHIGGLIENVADNAGVNVSELFAGHGVGSYFHGYPEVCHYENDLDQGEMLPGMTFTVEPVLVENFDESYKVWDDKWTYQTLTNARSAQFEHTVLITEHGHEVLTGPSVVDFQSM